MKKVLFTILAAFALVILVNACTKDTASDNVYEQNAIDNDEVKDGDI